MDHSDLCTLLDRPADSMLRGILNASPVAAGLSLDGKIVYANPALVELWGYEHTGHLVGRSIFDIVAPEWREFSATLWRIRPEEFSRWEYELEGIRSDGTRFSYVIRSLSFQLEMGRATFAYFIPIERCMAPDDQLALILDLLERQPEARTEVSVRSATT
jgi:PAS domain S-box-containing protein